MIRRLLVLTVIACGIVALAKASAKRLAAKGDDLAQADWEAEGGAPLPHPVDTPLARQA